LRVACRCFTHIGRTGIRCVNAGVGQYVASISSASIVIIACAWARGTVSSANIASIDPRTGKLNGSGNSEFAAPSVSLGEEKVEVVRLSNSQGNFVALGIGQAVQTDVIDLGIVNTAKIDDQSVSHEDPEIVITTEIEDLASVVSESSMSLQSKMIIVPSSRDTIECFEERGISSVEAIITPTHSINGIEVIDIDRVHVRKSGAKSS